MLRPALLLICYCLMMPSQAQTLFLSDEGHYKLAPYVYYLQEPDRALTIEDVIASSPPLTWQKNELEDFNLGFSTKGYWLKIKLHNQYPLVSKWVLEIAYPSLDYVEAYFYDSAGNIDALYFAGDQFEADKKVVNHPHIVFPVNLPAHQDYTLYIRVKTQGAVQVPLTLWQWEEFNFHTLVHFLLQGIFYGMVLLMALYNFVVWLAEKKAIYLYYVAYILFFALFQACLHGIGFQFIWPNLPKLNNVMTPVSMALMVAALTYFINDFFTYQESRPKLHKLLKFGSYFYAVLAIIFIFTPYSIAIVIMTILASICIFLLVFLIIYMLKVHHPSAKYFALAWVVFLSGAALLAGNKLGVIPITIFSEYGLQFGAGLEMMFLSLALADQLASSQKAKIQAQEASLQLAYQVNMERDKTIAAELENYRLEKENSQNLESLVSERTEELNTAIEKLSIAHDKLKTVSITDALTQVFNRFYFDKHWRIEHKRAYREQTHLSLIMLDIDHFKSVNDNYGHPAGDMCLQQVAQCILKYAARGSDIVCRYGGEEFIIILPGTDELGAIAVAETTREEIAKLELSWEERAITLTASLGISSLIPNNSQINNRQLMINQADQALYQAKNNGRNQVIVFDTKEH